MTRFSTAEINAQIGKRLAAVRAKTGLIQADFAVVLDLTARAYANYERGEREVPVALYKALIQHYNVDPVWLLNGPGDEPQSLAQRRLDTALLEVLIELIETWEKKHRKPIQPRKKAQLIGLAYDRFSETGKVDQTLLTDFLGLAA